MKPIFIVIALSIAVLLSAGTFASDVDSACRTIGQKSYQYNFGSVKGTFNQTYVITRRPFEDLVTIPIPELSALEPITQHETQTWVVNFDLGSSEITENEEKKLYRLSNIINRNQTAEVTGYTCRAGTLDINNRLAWRRAETVARWLKFRGIKVGRVSGQPKCCYVSDQEPEKNRRVEIIFTPFVNFTR